MEHEAPRRRRSPIAEYRAEVNSMERGLSWWMLFHPDVLLTLGPFVLAGIWLLAEGDYLWGALSLAVAIALPLYFVLLMRGESRLLRRLGDRRARRLARKAGNGSRPASVRPRAGARGSHPPP